jgi:hypothetical protein
VEYVNSKTKVTIICPIHGEFQQTPSKHLQGHGCIKCNGGVQLSTNNFIERAKQIHGDKYDYSKVEYINSNSKVTIICPEHGEFQQRASNHLLGVGCPICSGKIRLTLNEFIEQAKKIHGNKYNYSNVEYVNSKTKVTIICPIHGEFQQTPTSHLSGQGCPKCSGNNKKTKELFIEQAKEIHGNTYDYSKVNYINIQTQITIICPIHGEFQQTPHNHLRGQGCPKCNASKLEEKIRLYLEKNNINYEEQKTFEWLKNKTNLKLDFYLPKYNIAIECQGLQHYKPINFFGGEKGFDLTIQRDKIKKELCEKNNIKLVYFSNFETNMYEVYTDIDKLINYIICK